MGIEQPAVWGDGKIVDYLAGIGIQPLLAWIEDPSENLGPNCKVYGIWQKGNERDLFNGYLEVNLDLDESFDDEEQDIACYRSGATVDPASTFNSYAGFRYGAPDLTGEDEVGYLYGMYFEPIVGTGPTVESPGVFCIYQAGSEINHFGGLIETDSDIDVGGDATIDGSLIINGTERVRAYVNTAQNDLTNGNWTKVNFDGENYHAKTSFDTTNHRFTPVLAGYYQVDASVSLSSLVSFKAYGLAIYVTGGLKSQSFSHAASTDEFSVDIHDRVYLNGVSDYIEIYVKSKSNSNTVDITTGTEYSYVTIQKEN